MLGAVLVGVVVVAATALAARVTGQPAGLFTRDVRILSFEAGADLPAYVGAVSLLTTMVWAMAGALALCAATLVPAHRVWAGVLGALLLLFAVDDAYMVHESIAPALGLPEETVYVAYALLGGWLLVASFRWHRDCTTGALLVGGAFLVVSSAVDLLSSGQYLLEDGAKLVGALVLLTVPVVILASAAAGGAPHQP